LGVALASYTLRLKSRGVSLDFAIGVTLVAMLLISPLSWEHYDVILFPVIALLLGRRMPLALRWGAALWILAMTIGFVVRQPWEQAELLGAGLPSLLGRVFLFAMMVLAAESAIGQPSASNVASPLTHQPGR
jgi:hypothetical protein